MCLYVRRCVSNKAISCNKFTDIRKMLFGAAEKQWVILLTSVLVYSFYLRYCAQKTLRHVCKPSCVLRESHIASCLQASHATPMAISSMKH